MSKKLEISEETYERIKDQLVESHLEDIDTFVDRQWFIRTVTYHSVGLCTAEMTLGGSRFLLLKQASWIPDSGRFMQAIKNGTLNEVEPVGEVLIHIDSIVDMFPWKHELPTKQR